MAVRYQRTLAWVATVVGAVGFLIGGLVTLLGAIGVVGVVVVLGRLLVVLGLILVVYGVLTLVRPFFLVEPGRVVVATLAGYLRRETPFAVLETDGSRLFAVGADGSRRQVPVVRWMAHRPDWDAVVAGARSVCGRAAPDGGQAPRRA